MVITGPIFDGPDAEGADLPDPSGRPHKDPIFGGVAIPKYFWKILVSKGNDRLKAAAFIVSQRHLIMDIDRIHDAEKLSAEDVQVFQVSVIGLAKLTKLDFGKLAQADSHEATAVGPRLIESYDDIRI
ncbi:DNA/RNA endonuclease G (NUC1) [Bradyrhizobium sp. AZCC 1610]